MLENHEGEKILQIVEKITVDFLSVASSIYHCVFLSGSTSGDVRWYPSLVLGSLFKTTRDLLSVADSFSCLSSHSIMGSQV